MKQDNTEMIKEVWSDMILSENDAKKFKNLRPEFFIDQFINEDIDNSYTLNTIRNSTKNYLSHMEEVKSEVNIDSEKLKKYLDKHLP